VFEGAAGCVGPSPVELGFDDDAVVDCDAQLVYLDPEAEPGGGGGPGDPLADFGRAYELARSRARQGAKAGAEATLVVMASGTLEHAGPIILGERVSIVGGFSRSGSDVWTYDPLGERRTRILIRRRPFDATTLGVLARGLTGHTVVGHVDVVVDDALDADEIVQIAPRRPYAGGSSVGLWALDTSGLTLRHSTITPGDGGMGSNGLDGAHGGPGSPGRIGPHGTNQGVLTHPAPPEVASGGLNQACDAHWGTPDGGHGGRSGGACTAGMTDSCDYFESRWHDALVPEPGADTPGALGGGGGEPVSDGLHR